MSYYRTDVPLPDNLTDQLTNTSMPVFIADASGAMIAALNDAMQRHGVEFDDQLNGVGNIFAAIGLFTNVVIAQTAAIVTEDIPLMRRFAERSLHVAVLAAMGAMTGTQRMDAEYTKEQKVMQSLADVQGLREWLDTQWLIDLFELMKQTSVTVSFGGRVGDVQGEMEIYDMKVPIRIDPAANMSVSLLMAQLVKAAEMTWEERQLIPMVEPEFVIGDRIRATPPRNDLGTEPYPPVEGVVVEVTTLARDFIQYLLQLDDGTTSATSNYATIELLSRPTITETEVAEPSDEGHTES